VSRAEGLGEGALAIVEVCVVSAAEEFEEANWMRRQRKLAKSGGKEAEGDREKCEVGNWVRHVDSNMRYMRECAGPLEDISTPQCRTLAQKSYGPIFY
jgi:hypothetical protein